MIISVDPTNTEDIATFALVKQYRLVPLSTTLATTAWTADATNGGYTLTQNVSDTGILIYTDPSVVVAFNASVEDATSAPAGQDANVIATEIQADATNTSYIVTFHADTIPVADVVVNLLIYGTTIPGQSSGEDPATAEEITAAVLQNLDGRVSALETAIPNKVDKRTGAGKYAYTHDGSTQGDTEIVDGTTAATIPIRDANGRMQAADPASGATDKTLVTANWVSQTGGSRPNNLIHSTGNELIGGDNTFSGYNSIIRQSPVFACKSNVLEIGSVPGVNISYGMQFTDKNNTACGGVTNYHGSNGISQTLINLRNPTNNIAVTLHLQVNTDGSVSLYMDATGGRSVTIATLPAYP